MSGSVQNLSSHLRPYPRWAIYFLGTLGKSLILPEPPCLCLQIGGQTNLFLRALLAGLDVESARTAHTHGYIQCSVLSEHRHSPTVVIIHIIIVVTIVGITIIVRRTRYWFDLAVRVGRNLSSGRGTENPGVGLKPQ